MMDPGMDACKLQLIFPEEIWLLFAEQIQDTRDYQRLYDSSPYFRNLLLELRVLKLFPEVAKVFCSQIRKNHVMKRQAITKFRSVCRTWKKWTDVALHQLPLERLPEDTIEFNWFPGPKNLLFTEDYFTSTEQIQSFRQHFDETHASTNRNPFLCRKVNVMYGHFKPNAILIEQLLRLYGHHIWYFSLKLLFWDRYQNALQHYKKFYEMLKLMPNLKTLSLTGGLGISAVTCEQLELYVKTHHFPKLEHLHYLKIFKIPPPILDGLLQANQHISVCNIKLEYLGTYQNEPALFTTDFRKLDQLSIELNNTRQLQQLQNYGFAWPIRKLFVKLTPEVSCNDFITLLGNKSPATLKELSLVLLKSGQLLQLAPLQLPSLEVFSLKTVIPTPLDFLLPTKNTLKRLRVRVYDRLENISLSRFRAELLLALKAENTVKFLGFRSNLTESNIWSVFPQLRSVEYYDREVGYLAKPERQTRRFDLMLKRLADVH